jgi:hypothetical protein
MSRRVKEFDQLTIDRGAGHFGTDSDIAFAPQSLAHVVYGDALAGLGQFDGAFDQR